MADHLIFEPVQPVKQSIQMHEQFQGLNYMVEIKKLYYECLSRLGSSGVLMLSAEVMMQQHTTVLRAEQAHRLRKEHLSWWEGLPWSLEMSSMCLAVH